MEQCFSRSLRPGCSPSGRLGSLKQCFGASTTNLYGGGSNRGFTFEGCCHARRGRAESWREGGRAPATAASRRRAAHRARGASTRAGTRSAVAILAISIWPLYETFASRISDEPSGITAFFFTLLVALIVFTPMALAIYQVAQQSDELASWVTQSR